MAECKVEQNKARCACTYPCGKKGMCCDCIKFHWDRRELPGCLFPPEDERTYDRSLANFIRVWQDKV